MSVAIDTQIQFDFKGETISWMLLAEKENITDVNSFFTINCNHKIFRARFKNTSMPCKSLRDLLVDVEMSDDDYFFFYMMERSTVNSLSAAKNIHTNTYHINDASHSTLYRQAC